MAGSDEGATQPRRDTSRGPSTTSRKSEEGLHRTISGNYLDDSSNYYGHGYNPKTETIEDDENCVNSTDLAEKELELATDLERGSSDNVTTEVRDGIGNKRDMEARETLARTRTSKSAKSGMSIRDPSLVTWEGPNDIQNPKNWSLSRKWAATFVVSSFTFISPVSSSMVAPALNAIGKDLNITNEITLSLTLSVFILAYAIGPLYLGPLSEIYGRVLVLQLSNLFYLFFNLGCGLAQTKVQMIIFRFLAGLGGSAPLAIGGGVMADLFDADQRGRAISLYALAPLLGPAVGPVAGGFITENVSWRWVFYATCITDVLIQISGLFFLQETYTPVLLGRKKRRLIKQTGNQSLHTQYDAPNRTYILALKIALTRPFKLLGTQIIIQIFALYMAFIYGLMYLVLSTFPTLWENQYHESIGIGGLNYISLGLGFFLGSQSCAFYQDKLYKALKKRNNGVGRPEFRVPLMIPGALLVPVGLFWYGWSAQSHIHWIMPNIGAVIFSAGILIVMQCIQTYIVDSYTTYAASAIAGTTVLRSLAGFGFPLFAPFLYQSLHYGWGNSLLAFIAIGIGWPAPFLLWKYGETLRKRSTFAAG